MGKVYAEIEGKRIVLHSNLNSQARKIVGHSPICKNAAFQHWSLPFTFATCWQLREVFKDELEIGPNLRLWAIEHKARCAYLKSIMKQKHADLPRIKAEAPRLYDALQSRPYQSVDVAYQVAARIVLNQNSPRLGKSLETIGSIIEAGLTGSIAVAAPSAGARLTWPEELEKWVPEDRYYVPQGPRKERQIIIDEYLDDVEDAPGNRTWLLANFELFRANREYGKLCPQESSLRWIMQVDKSQTRGFWHHPYADLFELDYSTFVVDELHYALITNTSVLTKMKAMHRVGLGLIRVKDNGLRLALSGTPFRGKRENMWGTLNWLDPETYNSYWQWAQTWFETYDAGNKLEIGDLIEKRKPRFYDELDSISIRRTRAEVAPDLPPKLYAGRALDPAAPEVGIGHWLAMGDRQAALYEAMRKHGQAQLESGLLVGQGVLSEITRLKQFSSSAGDLKMSEDGELSFYPKLPSNKFDWLVNYLTETGIIGDFGSTKVVIGSQFTKIINLFAAELKKLGVDPVLLTGQITDKQRKANKLAFQEGDARLFMINTKAGGVSITLDAGDEIVILDETNNPDDQEQLEDRLPSLNKLKQIIVHYVRSLGTIEETICAQNENLDTLQKQLLDGRRGVEFAKKLLGE